LTTDFSSKLKIKATASIDPELAEILAPANLARHSGAGSCSMTLARIGEDAVLEIRDEGSGFDPDQASGQGFGLRNLRERAARLHGRLSILSAPGKGTAVRLIIPLKHTRKRKPTVNDAVTDPAGHKEPGSRV
jgi:signal transduction histidine kinase